MLLVKSKELDMKVIRSPLKNAELRKKLQSRQAGLTLGEALFWLLLLAGLLIAVYNQFGLANSSSRAASEKTNLVGLITSVKGMYGTQNDFGTANITSAIVTNQAAPKSMIVGTGLLNNFGGAVTVTGKNATFTIAYAAVPRKECVELAQAGIDPVAVRVNGTAIAMPTSPTAVVTACSAVENSIEWDVGR
jgi:hypothetical protein